MPSVFKHPKENSFDNFSLITSFLNLNPGDFGWITYVLKIS